MGENQIELLVLEVIPAQTQGWKPTYLCQAVGSNMTAKFSEKDVGGAKKPGDKVIISKTTSKLRTAKGKDGNYHEVEREWKVKEFPPANLYDNVLSTAPNPVKQETTDAFVFMDLNKMAELIKQTPDGAIRGLMMKTYNEKLLIGCTENQTNETKKLYNTMKGIEALLIELIQLLRKRGQ